MNTIIEITYCLVLLVSVVAALTLAVKTGIEFGLLLNDMLHLGMQKVFNKKLVVVKKTELKIVKDNWDKAA